MLPENNIYPSQQGAECGKGERQTETEIGQIHPGISCTFQGKSAFNAGKWCHVSLLFVFETQCKGQLKMGYVIAQWMGLNGKDGQGSVSLV